MYELIIGLLRALIMHRWLFVEWLVLLAPLVLGYLRPSRVWTPNSKALPAIWMVASEEADSSMGTVGEEGEVEKYKLRAKILEEALLTMRARYEDTEGGDAAVTRDLMALEEQIKTVQSNLEKSETAKRRLQLIVNEAQKDVLRYQDRTDLLERALSKSREKSQGLERNFSEAKTSRNKVAEELETLREENSRLLSEIEQYEEELVKVKKGRINERREAKDEIDRLLNELEGSKRSFTKKEADYAAEIARLKEQVGSPQETDEVKIEQLKLLIQSARTEAAELNVALDVKDRAISQLKEQLRAAGTGDESDTADLDGRLERTTQLLESTISLLSENNQFMKSQQRFSERGDREREGNIGSQAADYLIAGDLRDQRRILEMQSDLLNKLLVQMEAGQSASAPTSSNASSNRSPSDSQRRYSAPPPPSRQLPLGRGVSIPRAGIAPRVLNTGKKALHGVKRGLGFLVGLSGQLTEYHGGNF